MCNLLFFSMLMLCCINIGTPFFKYEQEEKDTWESPLDTFFEHSTIRKRDEQMLNGNHLDVRSQRECDCKSLQNNINQSNSCSSFLLRFINLILRNTGLKNYYMKTGEKEKTVTVDIRVTRETLETLRRYSDGDKVPYEELDNSFVTFFEATDKGSANTCVNYQDSISFSFLHSLDYNKIFLLVASLILSASFYLIFTKGFNLPNLFLFLFLLYYAVSVLQSLWTQYEDIYARRVVSIEDSVAGSFKIPNECYLSKLSVLERLYYTLSPNDNPCERYMRLQKSIFSEIDFEKAITKPFYGMLFSFLPKFGDSAGQSVSLFAGHFPFPFNIFIPLLVIYSFFLSLFPSLMTAAFQIPLSIGRGVVRRSAIGLSNSHTANDSSPSTSQHHRGISTSTPLTTVNNYNNYVFPASTVQNPPFTASYPSFSDHPCHSGKKLYLPSKKKKPNSRMEDKLQLAVKHIMKRKKLKSFSAQELNSFPH